MEFNEITELSPSSFISNNDPWRKGEIVKCYQGKF